MFERLRNGWRLSSQVRKKIFSDKALLYYSILSAIIIIVEASAIFGSFISINIGTLSSTSSSSSSGFSNAQTGELIVLLFLFYVVSSFTSAYMLMALYIAFKSYSNGVKIGIGQALSQASSYVGVLLEWAVFYSIVIMLIRMLEARFRGVAGALFGFLASATLSIGLMFAFPVIYEQKTGPVTAMKLSAKTFISHFGSSVGGIAYSDLYGIMIILLGVVIFIAMIGVAAVVPSISLGAVLAGVAALIIFIVAGAVIASTTSSVFRLVLYDYASGRGLPDWLDENLVKNALVAKRGSSRGGSMGGFTSDETSYSNDGTNPYSGKL